MKDFKRGGYSRDGGAGAPRREGGFGDRKPSFGGERKSFGDKPAYGGKPSYGSKPAFGGARSFDKKPWENRGGERKSFGDKPMYDAVCSNCGNPCQVPFKPNGMKPVLCNNCFAKQNGEEVFVPNGRSETPRSFDRGSDRTPAAKPANDYRIDNLVKQMEQVTGKLDTLIGLMSKNAQQPAKAAAPAPVAKVAELAKATPVAAPKKAAAKKEAPAKKAVAKPAKKAAKKK